jgi:YD repeat-containing protein
MTIRAIFLAAAALCLLGRSSMALTNGPVQPEFTSFEPVDVTDLVNLPTGNFTYTLPLGEVKGPAGVGYPVVLSYHAGVLNDQEASWVGLGWTLNVGAINRVVQGFPDDYLREWTVAHMNDLGRHGWNYNIGLGWGPVSASVGGDEQGFCGVTSIGLSIPIGRSGVGLGSTQYFHRGREIGFSTGLTGYVGAGIGLSIGIDNKNTFAFGAGFYSPAGPVAGFNISSHGQYNLSVAGAGMSYAAFQASEKGITTWSSSSGFSIPLPFGFRIDYSQSSWGWNFAQITEGKASGYLYPAPNDQSATPNFTPVIFTDNPILYTVLGEKGLWKYRQYTTNALHKSNSDGIANTDPTWNLYVRRLYDKFEYRNAGKFSFPSQDIYYVSGQGISGIFKPYSYRSTVTAHADPSNTSEADNYDGIVGIPVLNSDPDDNDFSSYFNNGPKLISPQFQDNLVFKMITEPALNLIDKLPDGYASSGPEYLNIDMEGNTIQNTYGTKIEPIFGVNAISKEKLGGFVLTDQQGKSYYYTFPLQSLQQVSYVNDSPNAPSYLANSENCSFREDNGAYATTWLLTSITGPDYIKRMDNSNDDLSERLMPREGDYGYWVRFRYEYGKTIKNDNGTIIMDETSEIEPQVSYEWRDPYYDSEWPLPPLPKPHKKIPCNENGDKFSSTFGMKEITYLKSIETPSEVAYFHTSERLDGLGIDQASYPDFARDPIDRSYIHLSEDPNPNNYFIYPRDADYLFTYPNLHLNAAVLTEYSAPNQALNRYLRIYLPYPKYTAEQFWKIPENTTIACINFEAKGTYQSDWELFCPIARETIQGSLKIKKDTYGCSYSADGARTPLTISTSPDNKFWDQLDVETLHNDAAFKLTPYLKCFYAKEDLANHTLELYVSCYFTPPLLGSNETPTSGLRTAIPMGNQSLEGHGGCNYTCGYKETSKVGSRNIFDIKVISGQSFGTFQKYQMKNVITRYQKKLDKIEWYSKSIYPCLRGNMDPQEPECIKYYDTIGYPNINSYKRVKFNYNYDLASQTPNSKAPFQGRLTLNSVQFEAGPKATPTTMPPYLFTYQNPPNVNYEGFNVTDPWGFRKPGAYNGPYDNPTVGVCWNLSKISLPSGGSIEMEYERDRAYGLAGALAKMALSEKCWHTENGFLNNDIFIRKFGTLESSDISQQSITLNNDQTVIDIVPGMYGILSNSKGGPLISTYIGYPLQVERVEGKKVIFKSRFGNFDEFSSQVIPGSTSWGLSLFRDVELWAGNIRVKTLTTNSIFSDLVTHFTYPQGGVTDVLPTGAIPPDFNDSSGILSSQIIVPPNVRLDRFREIFPLPYSNNLNSRYNTGNTEFIYPVVEVYETDKTNPSTKIRGFTRYYFYTTQDNVKINNADHPIIEETIANNITAGISNRKIIDRSSIVGSVKKIEYYDNSNPPKLVKQVENKYKFSENLASVAGVYHNGYSAANGLTDSKPLGMIRERCLRKEYQGGTSFVDKAITDVIISKPFMDSIVQVTDMVQSVVSNGLYDARTGVPMATLSYNGEGNVKKKLEINLPFHYYDFSFLHLYSKNWLDRKNLFSLQGGNVTMDYTARPSISKMADLTLDITDLPFSIISASTFQTYNANTFSSSIPDQFRINKRDSYSWRGNSAFIWPTNDATNWITTSELTRIDKFSRPQAELTQGLSPGNMIPTTAVYHPRMNAVTSVIQNASFEECGVFTCDYDENGKVSADYFDRDNGWEKSPGTELSDAAHAHFGKRSMKVVDAFGPARTFKLTKGRDYIASAWVACPSTESSVMVCCDYRRASTDDPNNQVTFPYSALNSQVPRKVILSNNCISNATTWKRVEVILHPSIDIKDVEWHTTDWFVRLYVGTMYREKDGEDPKQHGTAYVDDIRFYPADARVNSYYYDQELAVPIAFVDENGKAKKFEYDAFGRLTKVFNNAGHLVKSASYNNSTYPRFIPKIVLQSPLGGKKYATGIKLPIIWASENVTNNITVEYSIDGKNTWVPIATNIGNIGFFPWEIPLTGWDVSKSYWVRVKDAVIGNKVYDVTVEPITFFTYGSAGGRSHFILKRLWGYFNSR